MQPRFQLPSALPRRDHETAAAEARHAGLKRGERAQARIEEHESQDFAGERARLGTLLEALGECQEIEYLLAREISEIEKALHVWICASASANWSTWPSFKMYAGSRRST